MLNEEVIGERWLGNGDYYLDLAEDMGLGKANYIDRLGDMVIPADVANEIWGEDLLGADHMAAHGAVNIVTAKHLTSRVPLSGQTHPGFSEAIIPLAEGVSAYTGTNVYEVKAVTSAGNKVGTDSFYDRHKFTHNISLLGADDKVEANKLLKAINDASDDETRVAHIKELGRLLGLEMREGKDVLTHSPEVVEEMMQKIADAGYLEPVDINDLKVDVFDSTGISSIDTVIDVPGQFKTIRYTLQPYWFLNQPEILKSRLHTLFVAEGSVTITFASGKTYDLTPGEEMTVYSGMGNYWLNNVDENVPCVVYTQIQPVPEINRNAEVPVSEKGDSVRFAAGAKIDGVEDLETGENAYDWTIDGVNHKTGTDTQRIDTVTVNGSAFDLNNLKLDGNKKVTIEIESGVLEISGGQYGNVVLKAGDSWTIDYSILESAIIENGTDVGPLKFKVKYEQSRSEKAMYASYDALKNNVDAIKGHKTIFIAPQEIYATRGNNMSLKDAEKNINNILGATKEKIVDIVGYQTVVGDNDAVDNLYDTVKDIKDTDGIEIVISMNNRIYKAMVESESTKARALWKKIKKSNNIRIQMTDVKLEGFEGVKEGEGLEYGKGWVHSWDLLVSGLLQGTITVDQIKNKENIAQDTELLLKQITDNKVEFEYNDLYLLLPYSQYREHVPAEEGVKEDDLAQSWAQSLIDKLLITLPMQPLTSLLIEEFASRREAMLSA